MSTEPQKSEASTSLKEQIARKELEYFKHRYKLHERQIKELDDIIELLIRQREAEAYKKGRKHTLREIELDIKNMRLGE